MKTSTLAAATLLSLTFLPVPAPAEPPPWAPAHGWRKKNDPNYVGYTGKKWEKDYGVLEGKCNTAAVGAVLGGVVGGAVGSRVSNDKDRPVAIVIGTVLGAVIGSKIGAEIDNGDRGCMGHGLELAGEKRTVVWTNNATGVSYRMTPTRNFQQNGVPCREFTAQVSKGKKKKDKHAENIQGVACRSGAGNWEVRI
jgi:surface antigen